jgi:tRNA nucleotidyltransferase (CCA-adding enzyme)
MLAACSLWRISYGKLQTRQIATRLEGVPPLAIYAVFLASRDDKVCGNLQAYLNRVNSITPQVTGYDLQKRQIPPGPVYKRILGAIRDAWLDGKIETTIQEQDYLDELIRNEGSIHPAGWGGGAACPGMGW